MADSTTTEQRPDNDDTLIGWGIAGVLIAAAAASAYFQGSTAISVGYPWQLCWVLPVATDFAGFVSGRVWITARRGTALRRYAAALTMLAVAMAIGAAEAHALLPGGHWLVKAIGIGVPATMVGTTAHLYALWKSADKDKVRRPKKKTKPAESTGQAAQPAQPKTARAAEPATQDAPAARHAAPEQETATQAASQRASHDATVTAIDRPKWSEQQWAVAVDLATALRDDDTVMTTKDLIAELRAKNIGLKSATVNLLRGKANDHVTATIQAIQNATQDDTEQAADRAVGQD